MDTTFLTGAGAVVSAVLVFCGGVWMLLTMVMGGRLAYFITASITLAFVAIMSLVWSFAQQATPLGPVGQLQEYRPEAVGQGGDVDFGQAGAYPEEPWRLPNENDEAETAKAAEAEGAATDALEAAIAEGRIDVFDTIDEAQVIPESARLLEQDGVEYAAVLLGPVQAGAGAETTEPAELDPTAEDTVMVVLRFDPGNPLGLARIILIGTLVLLVVHLFGLSRAERAARRLAERTA
jgi:hypothetical protein